MNQRVNAALWLIAIILYGLMAGYVFEHGDYHQPDSYWTLAATHLTATSIQHQDFTTMFVPGYLLNVPLVWLGVSYLGLKWIALAVKALAFIVFMWGFDRSLLKSFWLPLGLILMLGAYAEQAQALLNYYSMVTACLAMGLGFYLASIQFKSWKWICLVLAGCFFAGSAFANPALTIGVCIAVVGLAVVYHRRIDLVFLISFLLVFVALFYWFFIAEGTWASIEDWSLKSVSSGSMEGIWQATWVVLSTLVLFFITPIIIFSFLPKKWRSAGRLAYVCVLFLFMTLVAWQIERLKGNFLEFNLMAILAFAALSFLYVEVYQKLEKDEAIKFFALIGAFSIIFFNHRVISQSYLVMFIYLPFLVWLSLLMLSRAFPSSFTQWVIGISAVLFMWVPLNQIVFFNGDVPISVNVIQTPFGVKMNPQKAMMYQQLINQYHYYGCANKAFMAFFNFPAAYYLTKRQPPFHLLWTPPLHFQLTDKRDNDADMLRWLKTNQHWCVAYQSVSWSKEFPPKLRKTRAWMKENAEHSIWIGRMPYENVSVWLYVR